MSINKRHAYTASDTDYSVGRHYDWECSAHEQGSIFKDTHGRQWTWTERSDWIERYMVTTPYYIQTRVRTCTVCEPLIAEALLRGENPFAVPTQVREQLRLLGVRVRDPRIDKGTGLFRKT